MPIVDSPTPPPAVRVAGCDEAGRGCLAGPVCAAAVILPERFVLQGLNDSKKLSPPSRERLAARIREQAVAWSVAWADVAEIEELNILHASMLAMTRAVQALRPSAEWVLVDGNRIPPGIGAARAIVGGDGLEPCIMAASILAKTARDERLRALDLLWPGYGFARHKGYGTPEHLGALQRLGPCPEHRRGFAPVAQLSLGC